MAIATTVPTTTTTSLLVEQEPLVSLRALANTTGKKSFRTLSAEVVHQISVLQRLKILARRKGSLGSVRKKPVQKSVSLLHKSLDAEAERLDPEPEDAIRRATSAGPTPSTSTNTADNQFININLPIWFQSLCKHQPKFKYQRQASQLAASRSNSCRLGEVVGGDASTRQRQAKEEKEDPACMCTRRALRTLWKRYFLAFPRKVTNDKPQPRPRPLVLDVELLRALLGEDVHLFHPGGLAQGKKEDVIPLVPMEPRKKAERVIIANDSHDYKSGKFRLVCFGKDLWAPLY